MIRRRSAVDGLPFRVYERMGVRTYSIGYKMRSGAWAFRYQCPVGDAAQIAALRRKAIEESAKVNEDVPAGGFDGLVTTWFAMQEALPPSDTRKRADSTLAENRREAKNIVQAFGHLHPSDITRTMGYEYLDACTQAGRPEKGNKEIALARLILEFAIRKGIITTNPFDGLRKNKTVKTHRLVTRAEMDIAVAAGRKRGGARLIVALALKTAWLCLRRSVEVRAITRSAITPEGIYWKDGKTAGKAAVLISWSDELRDTIAEVLAVQRNKVAGTMYLFGNLQGQKYTKGGWKAMLDDLMQDAEQLAAETGTEFKRFSLQDCRPMGVTTKMERGDTDTQDATLHTDGKMIATVYDRRALKRATPAA